MLVSSKLTVGILISVLAAGLIVVYTPQLSFADTVIDTIQLTTLPGSVAFDPANGYLYVTSSPDNIVTVIDGATNTVVGSPIPVGHSPSGITFDPNNGYLYVTSLADNIVTVINGATNTVVGSPIPVGNSPDGITFDPNNGYLYVSNVSDNTVTVINDATNTVIGSPIPTGLAPVGIAFDPNNGYLYVVDHNDFTVTVINGATNTVVGSIHVQADAFKITFDPNNGYLYVPDTEGGVFVIDGATNTVVGSPIPAGISSFDIAFDPNNGYLYATNFNDNNVTKINGATNTVVGSPIHVGSDPNYIAFDSANGYLYVGNIVDRSISVISPFSTETTTTTIQQSSAFVQQPTTGVNVTVSGSSAPDGSNISLTSINYNNFQPIGTGALSIQSAGFFDVKISGISDGTALVCLSNPNITTQTNSMQYWYNGIWNDASNPTVTGNIICGGIPVNALNGTPLVIGKRSHDDTDPAVLGTISAPVSPIQVNTQFTASDTFTDDSDDTHTATWNWGDGTTTGTVTESGGSGSVQNTHTYTTPGVYSITLTVSNSDGVTSTAQFQFVVAYDPNGGFVTGGGWINSPAGAYSADPSLTGKATFGFNSKYQNGATVPTGNTEFGFKVANLNFHSTSYDWLVIAGAKAQYKGTGTINGAGSYKFMLTAIDGAINGGGGADKFRMKITDSNGGLVYDNLLNGPDSADPTTVLGGGDIVIHKS